MWKCKKGHKLEFDIEIKEIRAYDYENGSVTSHGYTSFEFSDELISFINSLLESGNFPICDKWNIALPFKLPRNTCTDSPIANILENCSLELLDQNKINEIVSSNIKE